MIPDSDRPLLGQFVLLRVSRTEGSFSVHGWVVRFRTKAKAFGLLGTISVLDKIEVSTPRGQFLVPAEGSWLWDEDSNIWRAMV